MSLDDSITEPTLLSKYIKLVSNDGHSFLVSRSAALASGTIRAMLTGPGRWLEQSGPIPCIQFESINSSELEKIMQYFYYKQRYDHSIPPIPPFHIDTSIVLKLLLAANFLDT